MEAMRKRAGDQDEAAAMMLAMTAAARLASLAAIVLELIGVNGYPIAGQALHLALAALTILFSWVLVHIALRRCIRTYGRP
jgi:uncharacterized membrane protein